MNKLLNNKFKFLFLIFILYLPLHADDFLVLNGKLKDSLINFKTNSYILDGKIYKAQNKLQIGYYFFYKNSIYHYNKGQITNIQNNIKYKVLEPSDADILPVLNNSNSLQAFMSNNVVFIPSINFINAVNLETSYISRLNNLEIKKLNENTYEYPQLFFTSNNYCNFESNHLNKYRNEKWENILKTNQIDSFETSVFTLNKKVLVLNSCVTRGDLDSFRVEINIFDIKENKNGFINTSGILRSIGSDYNSLILFAYKKASIISELFNKNKVYFKLVNLEESNKNSIKEYSFKVSHKRQHIYYYLDLKNNLNALIQCKDGNIYNFNSKTENFKHFSIEFDYNFTFLRGINGGCFFDKTNNSFFIVDFSTLSNK